MGEGTPDVEYDKGEEGDKVSDGLPSGDWSQSLQERDRPRPQTQFRPLHGGGTSTGRDGPGVRPIHKGEETVAATAAEGAHEGG